jgi:hypothetical protein
MANMYVFTVCHRPLLLLRQLTLCGVPADWVGQGKACAKSLSAGDILPQTQLNTCFFRQPPFVFAWSLCASRSESYYNAPHLVRAIASVSVKILLQVTLV